MSTRSEFVRFYQNQYKGFSPLHACSVKFDEAAITIFFKLAYNMSLSYDAQMD